MDIQSIFYFFGTIYMILGIVVMIALLVLAINAYKLVKKTQENVQDFKDHAVDKVVDFVSSRPGQFASAVGVGLSSFMMSKVKNMFKKKKHED